MISCAVAFSVHTYLDSISANSDVLCYIYVPLSKLLVEKVELR